MAAIKNRFEVFQQDFKKDVGSDWDKNPDLYLAYYQARVTDELAQVTNIQFRAILNDLDIIKRHTDPQNRPK